MKAIWIASVPELTATQCLAPQSRASSVSSSATSGTEDELTMRQHPVQPPAQFVRDARLLRLQIQERNGSGRQSWTVRHRNRSFGIVLELRDEPPSSAIA